MRNILIGAAAIALAASGAVADPGKGNGGGGNGGKGGGGEHATMGHGNGGNPGKGNGGGNAGNQGQSAKADRGPAMREAKADRGPAMREAKADRGPAMREAKADRGPAMREAKADRGPGRVNDRIDNGRDVRVVRDGSSDRRDVRTAWFNDDSGLIDGCPPGLAKKNNGCTPPGLAKAGSDYRSGYYDPSYFGYRSLGDGRYYVDDGYMYRVNNSGSILGYIPLLGGALSPGQAWPSYYQPVDVPNYYVDYYNLGPDNGYRYADNVLYRVDPQSSTINSIAALLTGDQWAVGQQMPTGYDVYNVPYAYQDRYQDSADAYYRYSDGYVYEVDPTTQLVQAVIELLV